jgi:hypothetical protein
MVSKKEFDKLSFFEKFKLLTSGEAELTPEQQAEADAIRTEIQAQGGQTGEAAPVTGTDLADFTTSFGGGGIIKGGTKLGATKLGATKLGVKGALTTVTDKKSGMEALKLLREKNIRKLGLGGVRKKLKETGLWTDKQIDAQLLKMEGQKITTNNIKKIIGGTSLVGLGITAVSADALKNWANLDNIIGVEGMLINQVMGDVSFNGLDPNDARDRINDSLLRIYAAEDRIEESITPSLKNPLVNPITWWQKKTWRAGIETAKESAATQLDRINQWQAHNEGTAPMIGPLQEGEEREDVPIEDEDFLENREKDLAGIRWNGLDKSKEDNARNAAAFKAPRRTSGLRTEGSESPVGNAQKQRVKGLL